MSGYILFAVIGFIVGIFFCSRVSDDLLDSRIKAGVFERKGVAYVIKPFDGAEK